MPGNPSLRRALRALAAREESGKGCFVFLRLSTVLISVDEQNLDELKGLVDSFQQQLLEFIEKYPNGQDTLVQVATHLTPIGRSK